MGFTARRRVVTLDFTAWPDLDGLEVTARSVGVDEHIELTRPAESVPLPAEDAPAADWERWRSAIREARLGNEKAINSLGANLVTWNMTDEKTGKPVPATRAGLGSIDPADAQRIAGAWVVAMTTVPPPSPLSSSGGPPSDQERSLQIPENG